MENVTLQRYQVQHVDCAACAAKIEEGLNRMAEVEEAVLDFAGLTLSVRAGSGVCVEELVRRIDPRVHLIPHGSRGFGQPERDTSRPLLYREPACLTAAAVILFAHLFFEDRFTTGEWATWEYPLIIVAYLLVGWNVLAAAFRTLRSGDFFDEHVLMTIATVGAIAIHALSEALGVMLFYKIGELLQRKAVNRSRDAIGALLDARPGRATVLSLTGLRTVSPEAVEVADTIVIKPGEKIPLDGIVLSGESRLDKSPLTGESVPESARPGTAVMAGTINLSGALHVRVTRPFTESSIAKILDLVRNATARKAGTAKLITTFSRYYTPFVVVAAALIALLPPLLISEASAATWIYRALVLLVISCPCALMISVPLGYFAGIGRASKSGILVKGSTFIDVLAQVKTVVFDKTGTLTHGGFEVETIVPANGHEPNEILSVAAAAECHSTHPIGASIVRAHAARGGQIAAATVTSHQAMAGLGVKADYGGRRIIVGNDLFLHRENIAFDPFTVAGTQVHIAIDGKYAGYLLLGDRLKPEAPEAIAALRSMGVDRLVMLTGDTHGPAHRVSTALKLDEFHAGLLPEEKVRHLEQLMGERGRHGKVAFVGDGINDAPVLARADVGVAMGALGSDAAIETADVVLMTDSPIKLAHAIAIARGTRRIVWQNIVLALCVKVIFISFGAFGMATMWEAVFADMGTALLAVLNATRALGIKQPYR